MYSYFVCSAFEQRSKVFQQNMAEFLKERPDLKERLTQFNDILQILEKTPLLPCLMAEGIMCMGFGDGGGDEGEEGALESGMTLMKWISSQVCKFPNFPQFYSLNVFLV